MSKRHRIHRQANRFSVRYQEIPSGREPLNGITVAGMATRMLASGASATLEQFRGPDPDGEQFNLYVFLMANPETVADMSNAFCSALVGLIERGDLPTGEELAAFLPRNFAPHSNTGLHETQPQQTAGDEGPTIIILPERLDGLNLN